MEVIFRDGSVRQIHGEVLQVAIEGGGRFRRVEPNPVFGCITEAEWIEEREFREEMDALEASEYYD